MWKIIPGNEKLEISLEGSIRSVDSSECTPTILDDKVWISIYGTTYFVCVRWLALISHYEVRLPLELRDEIWDISFTVGNKFIKSLISQKMMIFKKPLQVNKDYRIIPLFTRYAVSNCGVVIDLVSGIVVPEINRISGNRLEARYCEVQIYDPSRGKTRAVGVHRLVALAWVKNDDFCVKYLVNHKDGVKTNNSHKNLEWTTHTGNIVHAFENNQRTDNKRCRVRDCTTGEVFEFTSIKTAGDFLNIKAHSHLRFKSRNKSKLINGKYEFRLENDQTPWTHVTPPVNTRTGRYNLHITHLDGTVELCNDVRSFKSKYRVWNVNSIKDIVDKAERLYPGMKINVEDTFVFGSVQAFNADTGLIVEAAGLRQLAKLINREYGEVRRIINNRPNEIINGFAYRFKKDDEWDTSKLPTKESNSVCILVTFTDTNKTIVYKSLREVQRHLGVVRGVITSRLKTGEQYRGMTFQIYKPT